MRKRKASACDHLVNDSQVPVNAHEPTADANDGLFLMVHREGGGEKKLSTFIGLTGVYKAVIESEGGEFP